MVFAANATAITIAGVAVSVIACSDDLSRGAEFPSPNGEYVASFFVLSGGGAAGWAYEYVSIRRAEEPFDQSAWVLEMHHGYEVCLIWESNTKLVVEYPVEASVRSSDPAVQLAQPVAVVQLDQPVAVAFRSRWSTGGLFPERSCPGCLATVGPVGAPPPPCESSSS